MTILRAVAAAVAIALATIAELRVNADASASRVLFALGSFHPTVRDVTVVARGIVLVGGLGGVVRRAMRSR